MVLLCFISMTAFMGSIMSGRKIVGAKIMARFELSIAFTAQHAHTSRRNLKGQGMMVDTGC